MEKVNESKEVKKLLLERESFNGNDGKKYWNYLLKGKIRGRDVKVSFIPRDKGGYEPLDIIFDVTDKPELVMSNETMEDSNGKKINYTIYKARAVENGVVYECGIKPARDSDKSLLGMVLAELGGAK